MKLLSLIFAALTLAQNEVPLPPVDGSDVPPNQNETDYGGIDGTPFFSCRTSDSIFTLQGLTLKPYPIPIGGTLVSTSRGVLKEPIRQGARLNVLGKLGFLTGNSL